MCLLCFFVANSRIDADRYLLAVLIDGDVNHFRFGDAHAFTLPQSLHFHNHAHGY